MIEKLYASQDKLKSYRSWEKEKSTYLLKEVAKIKYGRTAQQLSTERYLYINQENCVFKQEFTDSIMYEKDSVIIGCKGTLSVQYAKGPFGRLVQHSI